MRLTTIDPAFTQATTGGLDIMKLACLSLFVGLAGTAFSTGCVADEAAVQGGALALSPVSESDGFGGAGPTSGVTTTIGSGGVVGAGGSTSASTGGDTSGPGDEGGAGGCETGGTEECPECWDNICWGGEVDQDWEPEEDWGDSGGGGGGGEGGFGSDAFAKKGYQIAKAYLEGAPAECVPTTAEASEDGCAHANCTTAKNAARKKLLDALPANCKQHSNKIKTNKPCKKVDC